MSSKVLKYLILLAIVLLIVAISSFWFTGPSFRERDVVFELEGPTQISAGEEAVYVLKYANDTRSKLYDLNIHFDYPEGSAVSVDGQLLEDHTEDFMIDELGPGEDGEKEFPAFILGEKGSIKVARATVTFKAGNLSSSFEKKATLSTTIVNAPITLTLVAPPSMVSGGAIQYILDYRNLSEEDASSLLIEFNYPDGFNPKEYEPSPTSGNNKWEVGDLKKGSGGRITISGVVSGREGENKIVSAVLKRKISGEYVDYQKATTATVISNPVLSLELTVNNSRDYSASLSDRLAYIIKYSNNSNFNLSGMNLSVKLDGEMYDLATLDTRGGFFDSSARTIIWDSSTVPEFANLGPGSKGEIRFTVNVKMSFPSAVPGSTQDRFVKASAKFSTMNVPLGHSGDELATSASLVTKITTQPAFNQTLYYNDPAYGTSGPFPLRVGEETLLTVHWQLANPGNDIDNIEIKAALPAGIEWAGQSQANNGLPAPTYNPNSKQIFWNLTRLPYGAGIFSDKYEGVFRLKIKPSATQKGSGVQILDISQFTGTDNFTKQSLTLTRNALGSDNVVDRPREGTVQ